MKALSIAILIFLSLNKDSLKKSYHFDSYLEFQEINRKMVVFYLDNSIDSSFYLVGNNYSNDTIFGNINDLNSNFSHTFSVKNILNAIQFDFKSSNKIKKSNFINQYILETEVEKIDSIKTKLSVFAYYKKKRKNCSRKIEIIFDNSNYQTRIYLINCLTHGTFIDKPLQFPRGYPLEVKVDYKNGYVLNYKLSNKKAINTNLNVLQ